MSFQICCVPVTPVRAEPSHRSEMVTQLLFGECCVVIETAAEQWVKIRCKTDGYEGWCQAGQLTETDEMKYSDKVQRITPGWVSEIQFDGQTMKVPLGSSLTAMESDEAVWGDHQVVYKGEKWDTGTAVLTEQSVRRFAFQFLNTPYLWGGKSVFGVDCSGFVQTVFRFFNIPLLRDARQQATQGETIGFLQETQFGDLAFFDNNAGNITHVGILLNEAEIIHASVKVRVDPIDNAGILHADTLKRTHNLRIIKRYF